MWFFFPQWIILGLCLLSSNYLLRLLHVARPGMEDHQAHEKERRLDFHLCPALFLTSFWQIWGMENSLVSLHSTLYLNTWFKNISSVLKKKKVLWKRERKNFLSTDLFPRWLQGPAWSPEPGARIFFWVRHMGTGAKAFEPCFVALPGTLSWSWIRSGVTGTPTDAHMGC